jgi:hypothetical protein
MYHVLYLWVRENCATSLLYLATAVVFTYLLVSILNLVVYRQVLHFFIWNFVWADKANLALSAQTKFHIQKYDSLKNILYSSYKRTEIAPWR